MATATKGVKFIIAGGGLIGLLTAQALKARGIDFVIFDRDESAEYRENAGWAITLHWALQTFKDLLPQELKDEIYKTQVRPNFHQSDSGNFKYINAATGETVICIPPSARLRVRREEVRRLLLRGIDVEWNCKLEHIETTSDSVTVTCANGKKFEGSVLLGCDGANSITRRLINPEDGASNKLPIRFCGAKVRMTKEEIDQISTDFDPLLFQGTVPSTNTFFWFSVLSTPEYTHEDDLYYAQVNLSWNTVEGESFETKTDKAAALKKHAVGLSKNLSWLVDRAVEDPDSLVEINLCDWPQAKWNTLSNRVLLMGDSAHAMTMYRGEAANHGISDVQDFVAELESFFKSEKSWKESASTYCEKVYRRAGPAVLLSRQACLDAHNIDKIHPESDSPLLVVRKKTF